MRSAYNDELNNSAILIFITLTANGSKWGSTKAPHDAFFSTSPPHNTTHAMLLASHIADPRSVPGWGFAMEEKNKHLGIFL